MNILPDGIIFIKRFEGFSAIPYVCPAGKWTVGYGHVIATPTEKVEIDKAWAEHLLSADLAPVEEALNRLITVRTSQNAFDALCSLTYNIGIGNFARSTLLTLLNARSPVTDVSAQFLRWVYVGGKPLPGLITRRTAERELFEKQ